MYEYNLSVLSFEFRNEGHLLCPAGEREAAVKGREAARAVPNMIAATSAWEAVLQAAVRVETEQCTVSLSLTLPLFSCSFGVETLLQYFCLEAFGIKSLLNHVGVCP